MKLIPLIEPSPFIVGSVANGSPYSEIVVLVSSSANAEVSTDM